MRTVLNGLIEHQLSGNRIIRKAESIDQLITKPSTQGSDNYESVSCSESHWCFQWSKINLCTLGMSQEVIRDDSDERFQLDFTVVPGLNLVLRRDFFRDAYFMSGCWIFIFELKVVWTGQDKSFSALEWIPWLGYIFSPFIVVHYGISITMFIYYSGEYYCRLLSDCTLAVLEGSFAEDRSISNWLSKITFLTLSCDSVSGL